MNKEENKSFIRKTESLVNPQDVTAISFLGDFNKLLSKKTQHKIMQKGSRKIPYMGFIVDPYCFFLAYRIKDTAAAQALLPDGYDLEEVSVFEGEPKQPLVIISAFTARTSAFMGERLEFYLIARSRDTGLVSWIIADYETNTNSHDPKNGFCGYTSDPAVFTISPYGELLVDFKRKNVDREYNLCADIKGGAFAPLDQTLWVEGNLSVDYGGVLKAESSKPFSLIFDPFLMKEAIRIPLEKVTVTANNYLSEIIDGRNPVSAALFPYSQHFIIKQDLKKNQVKGEADLYGQIGTFLERNDFKRMKGEDIKKPLFAGIFISSLINMGIIIFLLIKAFS
jgi:hypothetical protein